MLRVGTHRLLSAGGLLKHSETENLTELLTLAGLQVVLPKSQTAGVCYM